MNAIEAAQRADLVHVTGLEPGYTRKRAGRGVYYADPEGRRVSDAEVIARIRSLAIPPAWTEVWICADPDGHIQVTGRDQRGRKQYRYHPAWTACRDEAKFSSLSGFGERLPKLRERVEEDLRRRGLPAERIVATVVHLLDETLIRIGNDAYAEANKSFGLTTLRARHLKVEGPELRFSFIGKSGKSWKLRLADRRVASVIRSLQELPGQRLFRYLDDEGTTRDIRSQDVNQYIREIIGPEFTSKHFRTWGATVHALLHLSGIEVPESRRGQALVLNAAMDEVAKQLRNTRAVCRRCYVHPAVVDAWSANRLAEELRAFRGRPPLKGLDRQESIFLRWLKRQEDAVQGTA